MLAATTRLKLFYLFHFSKPAWNRAVYQAVSRRRIRRIIELGIGNADRAVHLIEVAAQHSPPEQLVYTGVDRFEGRSAEDGPGTTLKEAYRKLRATGARISLLPGDPTAAFSAAVNNLGTADLVLATMACHGSIRAGDALQPEQAQALVGSLDGVDFSGHCPHGRPVLLRIPSESSIHSL